MSAKMRLLLSISICVLMFAGIEGASPTQAQFQEISNRLDAFEARQRELEETVTSFQRRIEGSIGVLAVQQTALQTSLTLLESKLNSAPSGRDDSSGRPEGILLGFPCSFDAECKLKVYESECGPNKLCTCQEGYREVALDKCEPIRLGDPCPVDGRRCHLATEGAACYKGTCSCAENLWNRDNEECRPLKHLNESCTYDGDCVEPHTACVFNQCACAIAVHGDFEYTLDGGPDCLSGRVNLRRKGADDPRWGYVCDDRWQRNEAQVFCRSLGLRGGEYRNKGEFGSSERYFMDDVDCRGEEQHIMECPFPGWGKHNCQKTETAGVVCVD